MSAALRNRRDLRRDLRPRQSGPSSVEPPVDPEPSSVVESSDPPTSDPTSDVQPPTSDPPTSDPAPTTPAPTTPAPTSDPAPTTSAPPTEAPTTAPPTEAPTTAPPTTQEPTTPPPSSQPPTQQPTQPPTTQPPTQAPTTPPPTQAPTTPPPSNGPTTEQPTQAPTTQPPTQGPSDNNSGPVVVTSTTITTPDQPSPIPPVTSTTIVQPGQSTDGITPSPSIPPETTLTSAKSITTTNSRGETITTAPATFTSTGLTTAADGQVFTVTVAIVNPTGSLDSGSSGGSTSNFFKNKGAVAGVFVVVGLAIVGIIGALSLLFYRRRRRQRLDREVTAAAVAASAAASRSPLDEEGDMHSSGPTSESYPSTMSQPMAQYNQYATTYGDAGGYDPFALTGGTAGAAAGGYAGYHGQGADGYHGQTGDGQYDSLDPSGTGYFYDAQGYEGGGYTDDPYGAPHPAYGQGGAGQAIYHDGGYEDPYNNAYSGGEGSIDTPLERPDPLHVTNPSTTSGDLPKS